MKKTLGYELKYNKNKIRLMILCVILIFGYFTNRTYMMLDTNAPTVLGYNCDVR